mmetsp:Transcript_23003/g.32957  ORF Transcript_23003/g.32957 Transcript_23003/m.32957 type:complete len:154 (-) Transcript_23003:361-822(-)
MRLYARIYCLRKSQKKIIHRSFRAKEQESELYENTLALFVHAFETTPNEELWPRPPSQTGREKRSHAPNNPDAASTRKKIKKESGNIKKEIPRNDKNTVIILDEEDIGLALNDKGQYDKALDFHKKALAIREFVLGKKSHLHFCEPKVCQAVV